jgi:hypothetical protein
MNYHCNEMKEGFVFTLENSSKQKTPRKSVSSIVSPSFQDVSLTSSSLYVLHSSVCLINVKCQHSYRRSDDVVKKILKGALFDQWS